MINRVKQALVKVVCFNGAPKVFEADMGSLVHTRAVTDTIVKSVWPNTGFTVPIVETLANMVARPVHA